MRRFLERIRSFGLYIDGRRSREEGLKIKINPFNGRVIGKVFLTAQDTALTDDISTLDELTPTEDCTVHE